MLVRVNGYYKVQTLCIPSFEGKDIQTIHENLRETQKMSIKLDPMCTNLQTADSRQY
jgi:hypothetical protein